MRERKRIKSQAKVCLKKHWAIFAAACLIAAFLGAEFSTSLGFSSVQSLGAAVPGSGFKTQVTENSWEGILATIAEHDLQAGRDAAAQAQQAAVDAAEKYNATDAEYEIIVRPNKDEWYTVNAALEAGKIVALANKETLVAAGSIVTRTMREHGAVILPVDSEHSAIFQCLLAAQGNEVERIHLTASGGPFREWDRSRIASATASQALKHPNWNMGAKVTIDSATMMNKGFEVIEARWLFDMAPERINVVVHPESLIHSMVEFADGAVIAQLGCPDMRQPIAFALSFPARITTGGRKMDFATIGKMTFEAPDLRRFPCLELAYEALRRGGNAPCALNAANEIAVAAYLKDMISFYDIARINEKCLAGLNFVADPALDDIFETNREIASKADGYIN